MKLVNTQTRSFLFGTRLLNKPLKRQSNFDHGYDPNSYLLAMKGFMKETRGVRQGSAEYESIRNKVYSKLREEKVSEREEQLKE